MIRYLITTDSCKELPCQVTAADCESERSVADEQCDSKNGCPDCCQILAQDETNVSWKDGKLNARENKVKPYKKSLGNESHFFLFLCGK